MIVRVFGLLLLVICGLTVHELYSLVHSAAPVSTGFELLLALLIVVTGLGGVLMASTGSELLSLRDDR